MTNGVSDTTLAIMAAVPGSRTFDTVAAFPTMALKFVRLRAGIFPHPLAGRTVVGASLDGARWCAVIPGGDSARVRCLDQKGTTQFDRGISLVRRPVTDDIFLAVVASLTAVGGNDLNAIKAAIGRPEFLPPVFQVWMARDGGIWLLRSEESEPIQIWLRLTAEGVLRDEIDLPRRYSPRDIQGDTLWATETNAVGLQTLSRCVVKHQ
jgi:hypothetical protein